MNFIRNEFGESVQETFEIIDKIQDSQQSKLQMKLQEQLKIICH